MCRSSRCTSAAGDQVNAEDPLVTLESDKATMDVPAPVAGSVAEVLVKVGDEVSEGSPILLLTPGDGAVSTPPSLVEQQEPAPAPAAAAGPRAAPRLGPRAAGGVDTPGGIHAGPCVRRTARELGVDLAAVTPTGPEGPDHQGRPAAPSSRARPSPPPPRPPRPAVGDPGDPRAGLLQVRARSRPRRCHGSRRSPDRSCTAPGSTSPTSRTTTKPTSPTSTATARNSTPPPRTTSNPYRVTLLAFLVKACVAALKKFPEFNASLSPEKDALILKHYYNIGIAVDTPGGLVVPVVKDADRKGIVELSREFMAISAKARDGKLGPSDMAGGTFTISSLGGIGGTSFTPIVNAPEVAILGVVRSKMSPVWNGTEFARPQHAAPFPVLRPPGHRRCAGRPLRPAPVPTCSKTTGGCCCDRASPPTTSTDQGATR